MLHPDTPKGTNYAKLCAVLKLASRAHLSLSGSLTSGRGYRIELPEFNSMILIKSFVKMGGPRFVRLANMLDRELGRGGKGIKT
jgi:hypothetical protein